MKNLIKDILHEAEEFVVVMVAVGPWVCLAAILAITLMFACAGLQPPR